MSSIHGPNDVDFDGVSIIPHGFSKMNEYDIIHIHTHTSDITHIDAEDVPIITQVCKQYEDVVFRPRDVVTCIAFTIMYSIDTARCFPWQVWIFKCARSISTYTVIRRNTQIWWSRLYVVL